MKNKILLFVATFAFAATHAFGAVGITATKINNLTGDTNANGKPNPGETLKSTVNIVTPSGATGVQFTDPLDPNTKLVPGTVHASPIAFDDSYATVGNTALYVGTNPPAGQPAVTVAGNVLANDTFSTDPFSFSGITQPTTQGGNVTVNADGTFAYTPPVGFTGTDTFAYTITNNADAFLACNGIVTISVSNRVWYVNNAAGAGDGRSGSPFNSLAAVSGASGGDVAGDIIYVETGASNYTGGITLLNNQTLWGQNEALIVGGFTLQSAGADPVIVNAAGSGVTLASGNTLKGFTVGTTTTGGIVGTTVGALTVSNVVLNGTGPLFIVGTSGALNVTLDSATTTSSGTTGISLTGTTGNFTILAGAFSGITGDDFFVSGGSANITNAASINNTAGHSVNIQNRTNGAVIFSANVTDSGTGILLNNNSGSTMNFTGTLALNTASSAGFTATAGGTVTVTSAGNTIITTTGIALNVVNTTIGATGLKFQSISANGAANGIVLDNTGVSGGLAVTGNSGGNGGGIVAFSTGGTPAVITAPDTADLTGGTIQNTTGPGILLNNTKGVSLTRVRVKSGGDDGIRGTSVTDFTLINSLVDANGNATGENGIEFSQLLGTCLISNSTVTASAESHLFVDNTSGTLNSLTIVGSQFKSTSAAAPGADGIRVTPRGTCVITSIVAQCYFFNNRDDQFQWAPVDSANSSVTFINNTLSDTTATTLGGGITINPALNTTTRAVIANNDINGAVLSAISLNLNTDSTVASTLRATVTNNFIGSTGVNGSGSEQGNGIDIIGNGAGTINALVSNNDVRQYTNPYGIHVFSRDGDGFINTTITGNTVTEFNTVGGLVLDGIRVEAGSVTGDGGTICADVGGATAALRNHVTTGGNESGGASDIRLRLRIDAKMTLPGYSGAATDTTAVQNYITARNDVTTVLATTSTSSATPFADAGASCTQP
jgi:hypothetical protein